MSLVEVIRLGNPTFRIAVNNTNFWGTVLCILLYRQLKEVLRYKSKYFHVHPNRRYLTTSTDSTKCVKSISRHSSVGVAVENYFSCKSLSKYSSESIGFRSRVMEYLGQRILHGPKGVNFPSHDGAYLLWLSAK